MSGWTFTSSLFGASFFWISLAAAMSVCAGLDLAASFLKELFLKA